MIPGINIYEYNNNIEILYNNLLCFLVYWAIRFASQWRNPTKYRASGEIYIYDINEGISNESENTIYWKHVYIFASFLHFHHFLFSMTVMCFFSFSSSRIDNNSNSNNIIEGLRTMKSWYPIQIACWSNRLYFSSFLLVCVGLRATTRVVIIIIYVLSSLSPSIYGGR